MRYQSVVAKAGACLGTAAVAWLTPCDWNTPVVLGRGRTTLKSMLKVGFAVRPPAERKWVNFKGECLALLPISVHRTREGGNQ